MLSVKNRCHFPYQYVRKRLIWRSRRLDTGRSVPTTAAVCSGGSCAAAVNNPNTDNRRGEEEDGRQEAKRDISLELGAFGLSSDAVPVPN